MATGFQSGRVGIETGAALQIHPTALTLSTAKLSEESVQAGAQWAMTHQGTILNKS